MVSSKPEQVRDLRWAIKNFRPLLQKLTVRNIPSCSDDLRVVFLSDMRHLTILGMGHCVVVIEQYSLPEKVDGLFVTSYDKELDLFKLHILINKEICSKKDHNSVAECKMAAVHEYTHAVAALSAIARVRTSELIKRLKQIFFEKTHCLLHGDISAIKDDVKKKIEHIKEGKSFSEVENQHKYMFPDEHFRLGFEEFPVSYPHFYEELLFSREILTEYLKNNNIFDLLKTIDKNDDQKITEFFSKILSEIITEKSIDKSVAAYKFFEIISSVTREKYIETISSKNPLNLNPLEVIEYLSK